VLPAGADAGVPEDPGSDQATERGLVAVRFKRALLEREPRILVYWNLRRRERRGEHAPILRRTCPICFSLLSQIGIPT
jgi:hypothetical protein